MHGRVVTKNNSPCEWDNVSKRPLAHISFVGFRTDQSIGFVPKGPLGTQIVNGYNVAGGFTVEKGPYTR